MRLVREKSVVALHLHIGPLKSLWVGTGTKMQTQYLLADDIATVPSGPVKYIIFI